MLYYSEFCLSHLEVPGESSLCIYISGCINNCRHCHYPELQQVHFGEKLAAYFIDIVDLYFSQSTCVCFLGEGGSTSEDRAELVSYARYVHATGLKTCLYSGRDTDLEDWMAVFDYIKVGSYREELGPLNSRTTNQKFYERMEDGTYKDITFGFQTEL
jgi:Pyruvate-formate lyase-activating enzyme